MVSSCHASYQALRLPGLLRCSPSAPVGSVGFASSTISPMPDVCSCNGCAKCSGPCRALVQTGVRFADYCRKCHRSHLCQRCKLNAIASSSTEIFCSTCLESRPKWCTCTGCRSRGGHHDDVCSRNKQNNKRFQGYCGRCASRWQCPSCGTTVPNCPQGDLTHSCPKCCPPPPRAQCMCEGCDFHSSDESRCTALQDPSTGEYCSTCAPAWECSCHRPCRHHLQSICRRYSSARKRRSKLLAPAFNICARCAAHYCACESSQCLHHSGHLCGKLRHVGRFCHSCAGNSCCDCEGCSSCSSSTCTRPVHASGRGTCPQCIRGHVQELAARNGRDLKYPAEASASTLLACTGDVCKNLHGQRLLRSDALRKMFHSYIFELVPQASLAAAEHTEPTFVF